CRAPGAWRGLSKRIVVPKWNLSKMRPSGMGAMAAEIYGLFSGRDGQVRYVGQTTYSCADRFKQHLRRPNDCLYSWFRQEWRDGYPIECVRLETCDDALRWIIEVEWMARFPDLLNRR